jgi:uncharacterized protein with ParB-like and HNH nuclease domain
LISAQKERLQTFFQGNLRYIVPFFQRAYVWDDDEWDNLWDAMDHVYLETKKGKKSEHFVGTVITRRIETEQLGRDWHELIDGQQRLATVCLLLRALP